jgi:hypothetical protein
MARISDMHKRWMDEPEYRNAYNALEEEFGLAKAVIEARNRQAAESDLPLVLRAESFTTKAPRH